ncbi:hypothetical protein AUC70_05935 [Methyloceanibacter stevinii]|uniref:Biopolymer transporter ExbD n=2 Tax=Methyloceanibacter stevinii TaxID=1774970 RepID=A0A1E3VNY1_9HYPH|nr:hypothetical protein AUC70_05935 [Methyloceanibacter stevinii]
MTPMIDVVFLLLIFFMLAAQFGHDMAMPLKLGGGQSAYRGPPRLVDIAPTTLRLNGEPVSTGQIVGGLQALTEKPSDTIILRARDDAELQRVIETMELLKAGGFSNFVLLE